MSNFFCTFANSSVLSLSDKATSQGGAINLLFGLKGAFFLQEKVRREIEGVKSAKSSFDERLRGEDKEREEG